MKVQQIKELVHNALDGISRSGQNGAMSAGGGSFNSLCGEVALKSGGEFSIVAQIAGPIWDTFWEFRRMEGLDEWPDNWHAWKV